MVKRNNIALDIIWLHVSLAHAQFAEALAAVTVLHENQGKFKISVNVKADDTEALIKLVGAKANWLTGKPFEAAVFRVFTEADHDEAVALVRDPIWEPLSA